MPPSLSATPASINQQRQGMQMDEQDQHRQQHLQHEHLDRQHHRHCHGEQLGRDLTAQNESPCSCRSFFEPGSSEANLNAQRASSAAYSADSAAEHSARTPITNWGPHFSVNFPYNTPLYTRAAYPLADAPLPSYLHGHSFTFHNVEVQIEKSTKPSSRVPPLFSFSPCGPDCCGECQCSLRDIFGLTYCRCTCLANLYFNRRCLDCPDLSLPPCDQCATAKKKRQIAENRLLQLQQEQNARMQNANSTSNVYINKTRRNSACQPQQSRYNEADLETIRRAQSAVVERWNFVTRKSLPSSLSEVYKTLQLTQADRHSLQGRMTNHDGNLSLDTRPSFSSHGIESSATDAPANSDFLPYHDHKRTLVKKSYNAANVSATPRRCFLSTDETANAESEVEDPTSFSVSALEESALSSKLKSLCSSHSPFEKNCYTDYSYWCKLLGCESMGKDSIRSLLNSRRKRHAEPNENLRYDISGPHVNRFAQSSDPGAVGTGEWFIMTQGDVDIKIRRCDSKHSIPDSTTSTPSADFNSLKFNTSAESIDSKLSICSSSIVKSKSRTSEHSSSSENMVHYNKRSCYSCYELPKHSGESSWNGSSKESIGETRKSFASKTNEQNDSAPASDAEVAIQAMTSIPKLLGAFEKLPPQVQNLVFFQLLRRVPVNTLQTAYEFVDKVLRRDIIKDLPESISRRIILNLDLPTLLLASTVSKTWNKIITKDPQVWVNLGAKHNFWDIDYLAKSQTTMVRNLEHARDLFRIMEDPSVWIHVLSDEVLVEIARDLHRVDMNICFSRAELRFLTFLPRKFIKFAVCPVPGPSSRQYDKYGKSGDSRRNLLDIFPSRRGAVVASLHTRAVDTPHRRSALHPSNAVGYLPYLRENLLLPNDYNANIDCDSSVSSFSSLNSSSIIAQIFSGPTGSDDDENFQMDFYSDRKTVEQSFLQNGSQSALATAAQVTPSNSSSLRTSFQNHNNTGVQSERSQNSHFLGRTGALSSMRSVDPLSIKRKVILEVLRRASLLSFPRRILENEFVNDLASPTDVPDLKNSGEIQELKPKHPYKEIFLRAHRLEKNWRKGGYTVTSIPCHSNNVITCLYIDDEKIISGSDDNTMKVFDIKTGKHLRTLKGHDGGVWALQCVGNILVSGSTDRSVRVWDLRTGRNTNVFYGHSSTVRCLQILFPPADNETTRKVTPDCMTCTKRLCAYASAIAEGDEELKKKLREAQTNRDCCCCCPCWATEESYGIHEFNEESSDKERDWPSVPHSCCCPQRAVSSKNKCKWSSGPSTGSADMKQMGANELFYNGTPVIVTGSRDTTLRVWRLPLHSSFNPKAQPHAQVSDPAQNQYFQHVLNGHTNSVRSLAGHGRIVVSGSYDCTVRVWDVVDGKEIRTLTGHTEKVYSVVYDDNTKRCWSGSLDSTVRCWDINTGDCIKELSCHSSLVGLIELGRGSLVTAAADATLRVISTQTNQVLQSLNSHTSSITCVQFDRRFVVSGSEGSIKIWDAKTGQHLRDLADWVSNVWQLQMNERYLVAAVKTELPGGRRGYCSVIVYDFDNAGHTQIYLKQNAEASTFSVPAPGTQTHAPPPPSSAGSNIPQPPLPPPLQLLQPLIPLSRPDSVAQMFLMNQQTMH